MPSTNKRQAVHQKLLLKHHILQPHMVLIDLQYAELNRPGSEHLGLQAGTVRNAVVLRIDNSHKVKTAMPALSYKRHNPCSDACS